MDSNTTRAYCRTLNIWAIVQFLVSFALYLIAGHTNQVTAALLGGGLASRTAAAWFGRHL